MGQLLKSPNYWPLLLICLFITSELHAQVRINGAGASFPYPIYARWMSEYNNLQNDYRFNYQSIGSGGGIRQFTNQTVHFGASDAPMSDEAIERVGRDVMHVPTVMGSVVVAYNLDTVESGLKLTGEVLAEIFMGHITKWNHPSIKKLNPDRELPDKHIMPVRRADGSGTTDVFSDYLNKVSQSWSEKIGRGNALRWPMQTIGARGNEGVTGMLRQIPGSIGYIELAYARQFDFPLAALQNATGTFIEPSSAAVSAAGLGLTEEELYGDYRLSITNANHKDAYPISAFTYILIPTNPESEQDHATREFLTWALTEGQQYAIPLHYAPLPDKLADILKRRIKGESAAEIMADARQVDQESL